jgi:hypothetical protein
MCLAWLEAREPESQSPGFASQAEPSSGLDGGLGFGLRLVKPKPGLEALALTKKNLLCGRLMNNPRLTTKNTPLCFRLFSH